MIYNEFGGTLNLAQFNSYQSDGLKVSKNGGSSNYHHVLSAVVPDLHFLFSLHCLPACTVRICLLFFSF